MGSLPEAKYCANGALCVVYPRTGKAGKLSRFTKGNICNRCQEAESKENFDRARQPPTVSYWAIQAGEYPLKARLAVLKRNLVAQVLGAPGTFRETVEEIRARWRIGDPPTQLPLPSAEGHYPDPPGLEESASLEELNSMCAHHKHMVVNRFEDSHTAYINLVRRWELDLHRALLLGGVPEEHVYGARLQVVLPWLRFAAACVLYTPPVGEAPVFAEYGGLPTLPGEEAGEEPLLGVLTARQMRESQKNSQVHEATEKFIHEKMWERRRELPDDYRKAHFEVMDSHLAGLVALQDQVLEDSEEELELNPPPRDFYIKYSPEEDKDKDVLKRLRSIRKREGGGLEKPRTRPSKQSGIACGLSPKGTRGDNLLPIMCALLLQRPGLTREWLGDELGLGANRVRQLEEEGWALLKA